MEATMKVAYADEVTGEVCREEVPTMTSLTLRSRLVAAAAWVTDRTNAQVGYDDDGACPIGTPRRLTATGVLLLTWGDRNHEWAIVEDGPDAEARLMTALGMGD